MCIEWFIVQKLKYELVQIRVDVWIRRINAQKLMTHKDPLMASNLTELIKSHRIAHSPLDISNNSENKQFLIRWLLCRCT